MKALIISDDEGIISQAKSYFSSCDFDIICYKWLLKALDNIEEIHPDIIFVSASEYPRHWKTLVQFAKSGIGGEKIAVFLFNDDSLNEDDKKKAKALGINGYFHNFDSVEISENTKIIEDFFNIKIELSSNENIEDVIPTVEAIIQDKKTESPGYVLMTNPENLKINTGKVLSYNHNKIECQFSYDLTDLQNNDQIKYSSFMNDENVFTFSSEIFILNKEKKTAILTIQEKYEEN